MRPEPLDLADYLRDSLSLTASRDASCRAMLPSTIKNHYLEFCNADPGEILGLGVADPPRDLSQDEVGTPIQEFYRGLNILITGGTGFIGKTLTQKLISSVPHPGHIYLLIRPKRGKSPSDRFNQLFEDHVFSRMKTEVPHYQELVTVVEGDIAQVDLGLSSADRQMLTEKVHVVFHSAADVRFVEPLRVAIGSNVVGSKRIMDLSRQMSNLKSYVHVSTAYSQCVRSVIQEAVPKMSISYRETLHYIETKGDDEIHQDLTRLSKIYERIASLKSVLNIFASMNWIFENENVMDLWNSLSPEDKKEFNFDLREVDSIEHLLLGKLGLRYFYLKEKMETIPSAERLLKCFKVAHYSLKTISGLALLKLLCMVAHALPI